ncbi:MAG: LacI family DNA-binding transcriptional regulator, partial [Acidobacteriaceae bacterium]|nr:LacI family DNA-binding transcriptional regulator [Acidobacteriaceae bacterium]
MCTIKDVAALSGYSFTTVSHVINRSRPVSEKARRAVEAAMEQLHYVPSGIARSLRQRATCTVGVLLVNSTHPFFAELGRGIEEVCLARGYSVMLCNSYDDAARQETYLRTLVEKRVDGLIVAAVGEPADTARQLAAVRVPVVLIDRPVPSVQADTVMVDNERAGYLAARHLLDAGHREVG